VDKRGWEFSFVDELVFARVPAEGSFGVFAGGFFAMLM
jgi:hypothetical protein